MDRTAQAAETLFWARICGIGTILTVIITAFYGYPVWRESLERRKHHDRVGKVAPMQRPLLVPVAAASVIFLVATTVLFSMWLYFSVYQTKPAYFWIAFSGGLVVLIGVWWVASHAVVPKQMLANSEREWEKHAAELVQQDQVQIDMITKQHDAQYKGIMLLAEQHRRKASEATQEAESLRTTMDDLATNLADQSKRVIQLKAEVEERSRVNESLRSQIPRKQDGVMLVGPLAFTLPSKNKHNVNFEGKILEVLYRPEYGGIFEGIGEVRHYLVLVKASLTNIGTETAVVTKFDLRIDVGDSDWRSKDATLDSRLVIKRKCITTVLPTAATEEITLLNAELGKPLQRGVPHVGWIPFTVNTHGSEFPSCGQFALMLTDSFGGQHIFIKPCGEYTPEGRLANRDDNGKS